MAKVQMTLRLDKDLSSKFKAIADKEGVFYSAVVEKAMKMWIEQQKKNKKRK